MTTEERIAAYNQAWENVRQQDRFRWSRIQTMATAEAAFLLAAYVGNIAPWQSLSLVLFGSLFVLLTSAVCVKDGRDETSFLSRAIEIEDDLRLKRILVRPILGIVRGRHLLWGTLVLVNGFNVIVIVDRLASL